tara:strand:- start:510 stop:1244 length:735 start_codon:yes stop_codon:yes gene_type:complete
MIIKEDYTYSSQEVADAFNLDYRKVTRIGKREGIPIIGKGYQFSGKFLMKYFKIPEGDTEKNVLEVTTNVLEVTNKKSFNDFLNQPHKSNKALALLEQENEILKAQIIELKESLLQFDKKPNEIIEVFTEEDYITFKQRLKEWRELNPKIERLKQEKVQSDRLFNELNTKNIDQNYENRYLKKDNKRLTEDNDQKRNEISQLIALTVKLQATLEKQSTALENFSKATFTETAIKARNTDWKDKK